MISGRGWPKVLLAPTEMTASCGAVSARNSGVVDVRLPWWPTLSRVSGPSWAAVSEGEEADPSASLRDDKDALRDDNARPLDDKAALRDDKALPPDDEASAAATMACSLGASASPSSRAEAWPKVMRRTRESLLTGGPGLTYAGVGARTEMAMPSQDGRSPARRWRTTIPSCAAP